MTALLLITLALPIQGARMKPIVCKALDAAKGKTGAELADAIEREVTRFADAKYVLTGLLPGDPPIACFRGAPDSR